MFRGIRVVCRREIFGASRQLSSKDVLLRNLRSLLFVPANSPKMLLKGSNLESPCRPDALVPDLEDSVPLSQKVVARETLSEFISSGSVDVDTLLIPRVNFTAELLEDDIFAVVDPHVVSAINVGKTQTVDDVLLLSEILSEVESFYNDVEDGAVKLIPTIECPLGLLNAFDICQASPRIVGVAFGADDYAAEMGFTRHELEDGDYSGPEIELDYVRHGIAVAARASGVQAIDSPNVFHRDVSRCSAESIGVRRMGMSAKLAIHPEQVQVINEVFSVCEEDYHYAVRLLEAYEAVVDEAGRGSFEFEGQMVDMPVVKQHRNLVELYDLYFNK